MLVVAVLLRRVVQGRNRKPMRRPRRRRLLGSGGTPARSRAVARRVWGRPLRPNRGKVKAGSKTGGGCC